MTNAYYNGEYTNYENIRIPLTDRSIFFGDGVYDAAIGHSGKIYLENEHISRLADNAARLSIKMNLSHEEISDILHTLARECGYGCYFLYFQLSRTSKKRVHAYPDDSASSFFAYAEPMPSQKHTLKLLTTEDKRYYYCNVKTVNLLPAVLASRAAADTDCDEAVFIRDGIVTECAHSNVSILKNETLITHPANEYILAGTGRAHLMDACRHFEIPVVEKEYTLDELKAADEVILTSASALCMRIVEVDGTAVGQKAPHTLQTLQDYLLADFVTATEK